MTSVCGVPVCVLGGGAGVPVSAIPSRRVSAPEALGADSLMRAEEAEVRHCQNAP